jgi:hypothetical protein
MDLQATPTRTKRPRILLGVTGSIAAVKAPRLALLLCQSVRAHVKVVLTRTVEQYFWKEEGVAEGYDREAWSMFWAIVEKCSKQNNGVVVKDEKGEDWTASNGSISVHCEYIKFYLFVIAICLLSQYNTVVTTITKQ